MASSRVVEKAMCMVLVAVALAAPLAEAAISCSVVVTDIRPCLPYVQGPSPVVPAPCCGGIKSLYGKAKTKADRQAVCKCLKAHAGSYPNINYGKASALPGKCGVNIRYKISPSIDCSKVQ